MIHIGLIRKEKRSLVRKVVNPRSKRDGVTKRVKSSSPKAAREAKDADIGRTLKVEIGSTHRSHTAIDHIGRRDLLDRKGLK